ncbi:hypothetical protein GCM10009678_60690 [Actinomadura kijaniata]|uniref:Uncharacterized protein n=1 Tax=Actinomadura namibiensis TaxID=182080 RepID=A0A7W3LI42_ACTNM|nr:hypothetical protein [Actinomadura namibiensis]MBA8948467.1 hypothetical protein [Actinomadura namibiensis]
MGWIRCLDGTSLGVLPVPSRDRGGTPFEVTLELRRDGDPFGAVGERCGYFLAALAEQVAAARSDGSPQAARWPDPDDRFPEPAGAGREPELFAFRYRDRGDVASTGELRCALRTSSMWVGPRDPRRAVEGRWRLARRAVLDAWGAGGHGVRAVLTSAALARFLDDLLVEAERAGVGYRAVHRGSSPGRSPGFTSAPDRSWTVFRRGRSGGTTPRRGP